MLIIRLRSGNLLLAEQLNAGLSARLASLRANTAMLHELAVYLTDLAAAFTHFEAGTKLRASDVEIREGYSRNDPRRRQAHVGAVVAIANALHHFGKVFFAQAGIGASIARFGAGIGGGDAFDCLRVVG